MAYNTPQQTTPVNELTPQEKEDVRTGLEVAKVNGDPSQSFEASELSTTTTAKDKRISMGLGSAHGLIYLYDEPSNVVKNVIYLRENGETALCFGYTPKLKTNDTGVYVVGSYQPFTGCHIATSKEDLKIGELVSIHSESIHDKQPLWEASYCRGAEKGIFGVVYSKQEDKYLIACVGDAVVKFSNENGPCEAGDYLVPSETLDGYTMVYRGVYVPVNHCGKAGQLMIEDGLIAWTKE